MRCYVKIYAFGKVRNIQSSHHLRESLLTKDDVNPNSVSGDLFIAVGVLKKRRWMTVDVSNHSSYSRDT